MREVMTAALGYGAGSQLPVRALMQEAPITPRDKVSNRNLPRPSSALIDAHFRSEPRNRGMQKSTPPLRGVFLFSVVQTEGANSTALQRADIHALPTAAAPPNTSSNSASIIVHARWSAARL